MTMLTMEIAKQMSTEDLYSLVWDWHKDTVGIRPRHMAPDDREAFLSFIEYELRPEIQEKRRLQWEEEERMLAEMEAEYEEKMRIYNAEMQEDRELMLAYDDRFDHLAK